MAAAAVAQRADPLRSTECVAAEKALAAQERAAHGPRRDEHAVRRLLSARRQVADVCLGEPVTSPPRSRTRMQPPVTLGRMHIPPASPPTLPSVAAPAVPPVGTGRRPEPWITSCDAVGCWGSDGVRYLRHAGTLLIGPHGLCAMQGPILACP
ncbi:MAG: hypothetical protein KIT17_00405 [Rubrivivax sp.]|nr:hypothetical protein [Rubrivivax sp.]